MEGCPAILDGAIPRTVHEIDSALKLFPTRKRLYFRCKEPECESFEVDRKTGIKRRKRTTKHCKTCTRVQSSSTAPTTKDVFWVCDQCAVRHVLRQMSP